MKIYLDRRGCSCWVGACETCFSWHYLGEEVLPNYCLLEVIEDRRPERTFLIKDRDGVDKVLVVDEDNWPEVHDGWTLVWERQHA
ncbi:MAG: hypothetical protein PVG32_10110 [Anaerolineales bacterium]|jgi:hypothetical protein